MERSVGNRMMQSDWLVQADMMIRSTKSGVAVIEFVYSMMIVLKFVRVETSFRLFFVISSSRRRSTVIDNNDTELGALAVGRVVIGTDQRNAQKTEKYLEMQARFRLSNTGIFSSSLMILANLIIQT